MVLVNRGNSKFFRTVVSWTKSCLFYHFIPWLNSTEHFFAPPAFRGSGGAYPLHCCRNGNGLQATLPPLQSGVGGKCMFSIIVLQKYVKKALEWRQETRQKSICAELTRQRSFKPRSESDTLYPRSAFLTRFLPGMEVLSC